MSVRTHAVAVDSPPRLDIRNLAGTVTVTAVEGAERLELSVEPLDEAAEQWLDRVEIDVTTPDQDGGDSSTLLRVTVPERRLFRAPAFAVRITTPPDTAARIAVASADVQLTGRFGELDIAGASGDLAVDRGTDVRLRTASGDARIGAATGRAVIASASGDVHLGRADGPVELRTASGDVTVDSCSGTVAVTTASGDVHVGAASGGAVEAKTVSGDATVGVVPGLRVWLDLATVSGRMGSQLTDDSAAGAEAATLALTLRSMSGDLRVHRVSTAPATAA